MAVLGSKRFSYLDDERFSGTVHRLMCVLLSQAHYLFCTDESCEPLDGPVHVAAENQSTSRRFDIDVDKEVISDVCGRSGDVVDSIEFKIASKDGTEVRKD